MIDRSSQVLQNTVGVCTEPIKILTALIDKLTRNKAMTIDELSTMDTLPPKSGCKNGCRPINEKRNLLFTKRLRFYVAEREGFF